MTFDEYGLWRIRSMNTCLAVRDCKISWLVKISKKWYNSWFPYTAIFVYRFLRSIITIFCKLYLKWARFRGNPFTILHLLVSTFQKSSFEIDTLPRPGFAKIAFNHLSCFFMQCIRLKEHRVFKKKNFFFRITETNLLFFC